MLIFLGRYAAHTCYMYRLRDVMGCWQYITVSFLRSGGGITLRMLILIIVIGIQRRGISGICFHYFRCQVTIVLRYYHMLLLLIWGLHLLSLVIRIYVSWKYSLLSLISFEGSKRGNVLLLRFAASLFELVSSNLGWFGCAIIVVTVMCVFKTLNIFNTSVTYL